MSSLGLLRKTIEETPDINLEEVLNDEEFIDEIKIKDSILLN